MRIDGFSSQSYPIKRTPRKAAVRDESVDDAELIEDSEATQEAAARRPPAGLPARQQDMVFPAPVTGALLPRWPATSARPVLPTGTWKYWGSTCTFDG